MTVSVDVYKNGTKLGSGTGTANSTSITSFTAITGRNPGSGRNVQVTLTSSAATPSCVGQSYNTRVITDATTTLTLKDPLPFS